MKRAFVVFPGAAFALFGAFSAFRSTGAIPTETHSLRLRVLTDILSKVPGNKVKLTQNGQTSIHLTNGEAFLPQVPIQSGAPLTIVLRQKGLSEGIVVGQALTRTFDALGVDHDVNHILTIFQPILQPVVLDSTVPHHAITLGNRWSFGPLEDSSFLFPANVGVLMTPREIEAFRAYYGLSFAHTDYRMGLIIHVADAEDLGNGMALEMDFESYDFEAIPGVDPYLVALSQAGLGSSDFQVAPALWNDPDAPGLGYYFLTGTLGSGMNVLLFREGEMSDSTELLASPPLFQPIRHASGGTAAANATPTNCTPEPPNAPAGLCCSDPPQACEDSWACAGTGCTAITAADCTSENIPAGEPHCGTADSTGRPSEKTVSWTVTFSGGVSIKISVLGADIEASAGVEGSKTETQPLSVGNGAGCGECAQAFQQLTTCVKTCIVHKRKFCFACLTFYCVDTPCPMACVSGTGTGVEHCDRTNCP